MHTKIGSGKTVRTIRTVDKTNGKQRLLSWWTADANAVRTTTRIVRNNQNKNKHVTDADGADANLSLSSSLLKDTSMVIAFFERP